jgi:hypothetical protein
MTRKHWFPWFWLALLTLSFIGCGVLGLIFEGT